MLNGFLEWYDLDSLDRDFFAADDIYQAGQEQIQAMSVWEAALKWVLAQQSTYEGGMPHENWQYIEPSIIEEELGESYG